MQPTTESNREYFAAYSLLRRYHSARFSAAIVKRIGAARLLAIRDDMQRLGLSADIPHVFRTARA